MPATACFRCRSRSSPAATGSRCSPRRKRRYRWEATGCFRISGGTAMLSAPDPQAEPLILNRLAISGRFDPAHKRLVVDEGDFGNMNIGIVMSGDADYSGGVLRLNAGAAGKRMSVDELKRLWPVFVAPKVRDWFDQHLVSGTVDHITVALNAPLDTLTPSGPPVPDNGLSIDAAATQLRNPAGGRPSGAERRRAHGSHCRPRRPDFARQGHRGSAVRAQAHHFSGAFRSARYRAARPAGARAFQARWSCSGGGRTSGHGSPARGRPHSVRSGFDPRNDERRGFAGNAAEA